MILDSSKVLTWNKDFHSNYYLLKRDLLSINLKPKNRVKDYSLLKPEHRIDDIHCLGQQKFNVSDSLSEVQC